MIGSGSRWQLGRNSTTYQASISSNTDTPETDEEGELDESNVCRTSYIPVNSSHKEFATSWRAPHEANQWQITLGLNPTSSFTSELNLPQRTGLEQCLDEFRELDTLSIYESRRLADLLEISLQSNYDWGETLESLYLKELTILRQHADELQMFHSTKGSFYDKKALDSAIQAYVSEPTTLPLAIERAQKVVWLKLGIAVPYSCMRTTKDKQSLHPLWQIEENKLVAIAKKTLSDKYLTALLTIFHAPHSSRAKDAKAFLQKEYVDNRNSFDCDHFLPITSYVVRLAGIKVKQQQRAEHIASLLYPQERGSSALHAKELAQKALKHAYSSSKITYSNSIGAAEPTEPFWPAPPYSVPRFSHHGHLFAHINLVQMGSVLDRPNTNETHTSEDTTLENNHASCEEVD
jgi:hypothetical protein